MMKRIGALFTAAAALVALAPGVQAAGNDPRNLDGNRLRFGLGHESILNVESAVVPRHLKWDAALWFNYANDPIVLNQGDARIASLLKHRVDAHFVGAIALFDRLQVGVDMPVTLYQERGGRALNALGMDSLEGSGVGDVALTPKVSLLGSPSSFLNLAVLARVTLPSATPRTNYLGERKSSVTPEIAATLNSGSLTLAANAAFMMRDDLRSGALDTTIGHEVIGRLGGRYDLREATELPLSFEGTLEGFTNVEGAFDTSNVSGLEALLGARYELTGNLELMAAGGGALNAGYSAAEGRVLFGLRYFERFRDQDGDGLEDADDQCPASPEDGDGFEDQDGCPDLDNDGDGLDDANDAAPNNPDRDGDGILDGADQCPDEAEDLDGFEDDDGCLDADNDGDSIPDSEDGAPNEAEDMDGFEDSDGVPDPDNDGDGIPDVDDQCPNEAEDKDGFMDDDGCIDLDNDADGVPDTEDNCPMVKGSVNNNGCKRKQLVTIKGCTIDLEQKVYFSSGRSRIKPVSYALLDNMFELLKAQEQLKRIRVEGHTDSSGSADRNRALSQERAQAVVDYLTGAGIDPQRLSAVGLGEEKPIASNGSSTGREANRRVEFHIEDCKAVTKEIEIQ